MSDLDSLAGVLGHADRAAPLMDYCTGLLLLGERKSVEPIASIIAPARVAAEHQSLLHFVGQSPWSGGAMPAKCTCASGRRRSLPRRVAAASARPSRRLCPAPRRSSCRSIRRRPPIRRPSGECGPSSTDGQARLPVRMNSSRQAPFLLADPHHVLLDGNLFAGHESTSIARTRDDMDSTMPANAMTGTTRLLSASH